ncbi:MAG: glycosyltransferase [Nanoarchaeota archaeon]|nr:glycosyltransferase [Nanoarchaeota archaeon]
MKAQTTTEGISLIIPIYGDFDIKRILRCVDSINMQKGVDKEIVVSEQGEKRRFPDIKSVKYSFKYHKPQKDLSDFNPGEVRNIAIMNSSKYYIYTMDADVIFLDPNFLKKLLDLAKKNPKKVFYRPFMRRLPKDNFNEFNKWCESLGFEKAMKKLIVDQKFLIKTSPEYRESKIFEKDSKEANYRKTFTSFIEDYNKYIKERIGTEAEFNFWPIYWNENRHCGSNFFSRVQFLNVGGYCEKFINWGCEDSDLQWKFRETYELEFFPPEMEVVHMDNLKCYVSPKMWARNEEISTARKKEGIKLAISADKESLKGKYGKLN